MRNTREIAVEYRLTHWSKIMRERRESGLSIKSYCKTKGIRQNVYHYWQRKLREAAYDMARPQTEETRLSMQGYAEVKLVEPQDAAMQPTGHIIVEVAGCKISTDSSYPPEALVALLKALQPC